MPTTSINVRSSGEGFGVSRLGGHDYGTNTLGVWLDGQIRIALSDTVNRGNVSGIGIFDAQLSRDDLEQAKEIHKKLCVATKSGPFHEVPAVEPATVYDVDCNEGTGEIASYTGKTYQLPADLFSEVDRFYLKIRDGYLKDAYSTVRLDAQVAKVERQKNGFVIAVQFSNKGKYPIEFPRPDYLNSLQGDRLEVQGSSKNQEVLWKINLAGVPLANEADVAGKAITTADGKQVRYVALAPYSSIVFKFHVLPRMKIPHGAYSFILFAALDASAPDVAPSLGFVNFHSDYNDPHSVTIDRDYPSTPQEWKDFETRKAKEVSFLMPGATVAESGYYRAASIAGPRDQFVKKFEQGTAAPDLDFQRWDRWEWEADLARATICKPGDACPREGLWILRAKDYSYGSKGDITYPEYQQRFRMGEQIPARDLANVDASRLFWEWLSA